MKSSELVSLPVGQRVRLRPTGAGSASPAAADAIIVAVIADERRYHLPSHANSRLSHGRKIELDGLTYYGRGYQRSDGTARLVIIEKRLSRTADPEVDGWFTERRLDVVPGRDVLGLWNARIEADVLAERAARRKAQQEWRKAVVAAGKERDEERAALIDRIRPVLAAADVPTPMWKLQSKGGVFTVTEVARIIDHLTEEGGPR